MVMSFWASVNGCLAQVKAAERSLVQVCIGATYSLVADLDRREYIAMQHNLAPGIAPEGRLRIVQNTPGILIVGDENARYYVFAQHPKNDGDIPVYGMTYFSGPDIEALLFSGAYSLEARLDTSFLSSIDMPGLGPLAMGCGCAPEDRALPCSTGGEGASECGEMWEKNKKKSGRGAACTTRCNAGFKACCNTKK